MRRGELRELRWSDRNLAAETIRVERTLDDGETYAPGVAVAPKSAAGRRTVPVVQQRRPLPAAHKLATGRDGDALVFGRTGSDRSCRPRSAAGP